MMLACNRGSLGEPCNPVSDQNTASVKLIWHAKSIKRRYFINQWLLRLDPCILCILLSLFHVPRFEVRRTRSYFDEKMSPHYVSI